MSEPDIEVIPPPGPEGPPVVEYAPGYETGGESEEHADD